MKLLLATFVFIGTMSAGYILNAWDGTRGLNDRNISTKIANKDFSITIASLKEDRSDYQEFNGTVCAQVIDENGNDKTGWSKLDFRSDSKQNVSFNIVSSVEIAKIKIAWIENEDKDCLALLSSEHNETNSTDSFAIRPDRFKIHIPPDTTFYAGEDFNISFSAFKYGLDNNTIDYNKTNNSSFKIEANETKIGCKSGNLNITHFNFSDGKAENITVNYDEIGDINLTIKEIDGSEFAKIDSDDTNDNDRFIAQYTTTITIKPYKIKINEMNLSKEWLYMADVLDMNLTANATVQALSKTNNLMSDFNESCYGKDVNITYYYKINANSDDNITLSYEGNITTKDNKSLDDINKTLSIPKSVFFNGETNASYAFNIDRNYAKPISPVTIKLLEANITTANLAKEYENIAADINATFFYGRVKTDDIKTNSSTSNHSVEIEVYKAKDFDFKQNSLNWYQNEYDSTTSLRDSDFNSTETIKLTGNQTLFIQNTNGFLNGVANFSITSNKTAYIHIDIPPYLWHNSYQDYNYSSGSDCSQHPCFEYIYESLSSKDKTKNFKGSSIKSDFNTTMEKIGLKVFR